MPADLDLLLTLEPHGTFHDAELLSVAIDRAARQLVAEFSICVGDPSAADVSARERRRRGHLEIRGLLVWSAPAAQGSWLTSYGPLREAPTEEGKALASSLPAGCSSWWLYFADANDFAYCGCEQYSWAWGPDES